MHIVKVLELFEFELWHPFDGVVKLVSVIHSSSLKNKLNNACVTYSQAKQTRDSFSISDNKASRIFYLVHWDLWGPYNNTSSPCGAHYFLTIYSR